jgi:hypothetical protein
MSIILVAIILYVLWLIVGPSDPQTLLGIWLKVFFWGFVLFGVYLFDTMLIDTVL